MQSAPLTTGAQYLVTASGVINFWEPNTNLADAAWQQVAQNQPAWTEDLTQPPSGITGLRINGNQVPWLGTTDGTTFNNDAFSPSHVYEYTVTGTGSPADFYFYDTYYPDNVGTFQVTINSVPEPTAAVVLFAPAAIAGLRRRPRPGKRGH